MTVTSNVRGHKVYWDGEGWRYAETGEIADDSRPCLKCGQMATTEGYDACLGLIPGAISACCGHGVEEGFVKYPSSEVSG